MFYPDARGWGFWSVFKLIFIFAEAILYPYYSETGFSQIDNSSLMILAMSQLVFMIDMLAKFFKAVKKEGDDDEYIRTLQKIV